MGDDPRARDEGSDLADDREAYRRDPERPDALWTQVESWQDGPSSMPKLVPEADPDAVYLRLSAQRALWGNVGPHVRSIYVGYSGRTVRFVGLVDLELPDAEREALQVAATELIADYSEGWVVEETITFSAERPDDLFLVYERYRPP